MNDCFNNWLALIYNKFFIQPNEQRFAKIHIDNNVENNAVFFVLSLIII